jgi:hypothetical protein
MAQVVEYLPLHKALSSNFHTTKKKKDNFKDNNIAVASTF